ncbi:DUF2806 domain-containing protein [Aequorivita sp. KMM 9714]|uniref:DUF2806 domain-containing protein n=1 Tax=Aequorivita sp. KMM 9714 TaxID=2707173 RepID=UPI0013EE1A27|nr:DUF2806 domain-containing protein [Aequorivita sp. KMM 9714]NGX85399.1 DUF2806 domain-containing protein [Aequorivita sp. KMM 9714]
MALKDILGIGKVLPMDKLLDVVSNSVGRLSKSYFDKKDIDSKAYEIKKLAEARAEEMKIISSAVKDNFEITGGIEYKEQSITISSPKSNDNLENSSVIVPPSLEERTEKRINYQEAKKQLNIESVTAYAAEELKNEKEVTDEPVDEDWTTRFFNIAEDISNEEMQALWGRILAGEIKKPKTYSLRTLDVLKNLSKKEAEVFLKFARLHIQSSGVSFILNFKNENLLEKKYGLNFNDRLLLEELGFLTANDLQFKVLKTADTALDLYFKLGNILVSIKKPEKQPEQQLQVLVFTKIGQELLKLVSDTPDLDYAQLLASKLRKDGFEIKFAYILNELDDGRISHTGLNDLPLTKEEQMAKDELEKTQKDKDETEK